MFLLVLKLYQMDVAHAILFARKIDISRTSADYLSAKFEALTKKPTKKPKKFDRIHALRKQQ